MAAVWAYPDRGCGNPNAEIDHLESPPMARVCHSCAKGPAFGNSRSHSMVATRRRWEPNLQKVRIDDHGTPRRVYVCTRCLKAGKVTKAV
jgi:large subunit ribosomal protein L28